MRQKIVTCLLIVLVLFTGIASGLFDDKDAFQPPLRSIVTHRSNNLMVLAPNPRLFFHDFVRTGVNHIHYFTIFILLIALKRFNSVKRFIGLFLRRLIFCFYLFYQIARTSRKQDDPALINVFS